MRRHDEDNTLWVGDLYSVTQRGQSNSYILVVDASDSDLNFVTNLV
jgi:Mg-chelatase subunit ChlD